MAKLRRVSHGLEPVKAVRDDGEDNMWALIIAGFSFVAAIILSLGKVSERGNDMAAAHREELLSRKTEENESDQDR